MKELDRNELMEVEGGFILVGGNSAFWNSKMFWRGVTIGAAAEGAGAALALAA